MAKFADAISALTNPENENLPDDWADQLQAAYDTDFQGAADRASQLEADLETERAQRQAEVKSLKAQNFDLLTKIPGNSGREDTTPEDESGSLTIDDLFK